MNVYNYDHLISETSLRELRNLKSLLAAEPELCKNVRIYLGIPEEREDIVKAITETTCTCLLIHRIVLTTELATRKKYEIPFYVTSFAYDKLPEPPKKDITASETQEFIPILDDYISVLDSEQLKCLQNNMVKYMTDRIHLLIKDLGIPSTVLEVRVSRGNRDMKIYTLALCTYLYNNKVCTVYELWKAIKQHYSKPIADEILPVVKSIVEQIGNPSSSAISEPSPGSLRIPEVTIREERKEEKREEKREERREEIKDDKREEKKIEEKEEKGKTEKKDENAVILECPVCFEKPNIVLQCGHFLCLTCLPGIAKTCPTCRKAYISHIKIYV